MSTSYVYLIIQTATGFVKVGVSDNPAKRLCSLQIASPFKLELFRKSSFDRRETAFAAENRIHRALAPCRISGEWFAIDAETAWAVMKEAVEWCGRKFESFDPGYGFDDYVQALATPFVDRSAWPKGELHI